MSRIRFSIASLLVVVLFVAVGFAFTLTLAVLLTSILLAIHRTESRRAFWTGFALFGWTYLALSLVPTIEVGTVDTTGTAVAQPRSSST